MFRLPFFRPKPEAGNQFIQLGQGGPSGSFHAKATTPISSVYEVGWVNGFSVNFPGSANFFVSPATFEETAISTTGIINGLMKQPGKGLINQ